MESNEITQPLENRDDNRLSPRQDYALIPAEVIQRRFIDADEQLDQELKNEFPIRDFSHIESSYKRHWLAVLPVQIAIERGFTFRTARLVATAEDVPTLRSRIREFNSRYPGVYPTIRQAP